MGIKDTIFWGIVSGVLTTLLLWIIGRVTTGFIIPWFESLVYKGIDISGNWKSNVQLSPDNYKVKLNIIVKQKGHRLTGDILAQYINTDSSQETRTRRLKFLGEITNNNIVITYKSATKEVSSLGVFLMKIILGGEKLKGTLVSQDQLSEGINSYKEIIWERE
jgi:hypothetical protein